MTGSLESVPVAMTRNGNRPTPAGGLSFREAREAPCLSCTSSPCCTHLLLADFKLETLLDVDHALYLLNFEGIVLSVLPEGGVDVYLYQPCGYLDVPTGLCTVHSTPLQPAVCVHYNAHRCGYRKRMTVEVDPERPLVDRSRMAWVAEHIGFDEDRRVVSRPDWQQMLDAFGSMPLQRHPAPLPAPDPVLEEWRSIVLSEKPPDSGEGDIRLYSDATVSDPCTGCGAWCCKTLVFNRGIPGDAAQLEFLRYCLGFPAVEVGVSADGWAVIVHTTCRHLEGNRCSVYGTDERPLQCGYYDALACTYRGHFGKPRPDDILRVSRDQFGLITDSIIFDDLGRITAIPPIKVLRSRVEDAERARVG